MCKIVLWVGCYQEEIRVFILHECNEEVVMDIFKMEDLFHPKESSENTWDVRKY